MEDEHDTKISSQIGDSCFDRSARFAGYMPTDGSGKKCPEVKPQESDIDGGSQCAVKGERNEEKSQVDDKPKKDCNRYTKGKGNSEKTRDGENHSKGFKKEARV